MSARWPSLAAMVRHLVREQEYMSVREAAQLYRVTEETMLSWADCGHLPARYADGQVWLERVALHDALRRPPPVSAYGSQQ